MEHINNFTDLINFLEELVRREELEGVAMGIAKLAISKGMESLSAKQASVINNSIIYYIKDIKCERCLNDNVSELMDYIFIKDNAYGFCPMCEHDREKFFKD